MRNSPANTCKVREEVEEGSAPSAGGGIPLNSVEEIVPEHVDIYWVI